MQPWLLKYDSVCNTTLYTSEGVMWISVSSQTQWKPGPCDWLPQSEIPTVNVIFHFFEVGSANQNVSVGWFRLCVLRLPLLNQDLKPVCDSFSGKQHQVQIGLVAELGCRLKLNRSQIRMGFPRLTQWSIYSKSSRILQYVILHKSLNKTNKWLC